MLALPCGRFEFTRFDTPQIKRFAQRLFCMSCRSLENDDAKLRSFFELTKNNFLRVGKSRWRKDDYKRVLAVKKAVNSVFDNNHFYSFITQRMPMLTDGGIIETFDDLMNLGLNDYSHVSG